MRTHRNDPSPRSDGFHIPDGRIPLAIAPGAVSDPDGSIAGEALLGLEKDAKLEYVPLRFLPSDPALAEWAGGLRSRELFDADVGTRGGRLVLLGIRPDAPKVVSRSPAPEFDPAVPAPPEDPAAFAASFRAWAEDVLWPRWRGELGENDPPPGTPASAGMCRISAACMAAVLSQIDPDGGWKAVGGHPSVAYEQIAGRQFSARFRGLDGGLWNRTTDGWDGHYWVAGRHAGEEILLDVAADQYGWDPVVATRADDPRWRANYKASTVAKDLSGRITDLVVAEAVDAWRGRTFGADPAPAFR